MTPEELEGWIQRRAIDKGGQKIGTITDVYVDDATGAPEWLAITTGLFGTRVSFAPLVGAEPADDDVQIAHEKSLVKDSPNIEADGQLTADEEARLYRHYGMSRFSAQASPQAVADTAELQESGSTTVTAEVTPEVAVARLRRRDALAMEDLDFSAEESATPDLEKPSAT